MAVKYIPYYKDAIKGQALLDNFVRTKRILKYADNDKVKYLAEIIYNGTVIDSYSINASLLYDGYLGKYLAYPSNAFEPFFEGTITGDIVINVKDYSSYLDTYSESYINRIVLNSLVVDYVVEHANIK